MKNYKYGKYVLDLRSLGELEFTSSKTSINLTSILKQEEIDLLFPNDLKNTKDISIIVSGITFSSDTLHLIDWVSETKFNSINQNTKSIVFIDSQITTDDDSNKVQIWLYLHKSVNGITLNFEVIEF